MTKVEKIPIPLKDILEGVRLCFENCKRLFQDSEILNNNHRTSGAIASLVLAQEEFAKMIILFGYYKSGLGISRNKSSEIFSSHKLRLKEFIKYFHTVLHNSDDKVIEKMTEFWFVNQDLKENHMYVDWTKEGWKTPESAKHQIAESGTWAFQDINWVMQSAFLDSCFKALDKDESFKKILNS